MPTLQPTKSTKAKKLVALPGEFMTRVVIPNKLVNAQYSYTLMQERIFNYVMHYLQYYIAQVIQGKEIMQLDMFEDNKERINLSIPLMTIAKPAYYDRAREAAKELAGIMVSIPIEKAARNGELKKYDRVRGLFEWVDVPEADRRQRSGVLQVSINKQVAEMLVDIEMKQGVPSQYTAFMFEVTMVCRNKYTPRFYKQLCSWRKKRKCYMSIDEIKSWLQLGNKYTTSNGIKQHILEPVLKELKQYADVWYDINHPEFEVKEGNKVVGWWFHIQGTDSNLHYVKLKNSIIEILQRHFRLGSEHIKQLEPLLDMEDADYSALQYKIIDLAERIRADRSIRNVQAYVVKALLNYHQPR